ncbi:MAG TPA: response regulator [Myxococcales bacterium]|jgi:chemosensory pili system protein ChpA (sensor histidine kinase/response regulator)
MPETGPVLVVDDNEDLRELLCEYLTLLGHRPVAARDGLEALQLLAGGQKPKLVLLDRNIPRLDGLSFLEEAGPRLRGVPVIWMTGAADDVQHPLVRATLRKPFDLEALERAVRTYVTP